MHQKHARKKKEQEPLIKRRGNTPAKLAALQQAREEERFARYQQALALRAQGLSHQAIADRLAMGHSTVQRWLQAGQFPRRKPREQASQLDRYLPYIHQRRAQGCYNMVQLHREIQEKGYKGSYSAMKNILDRVFPKERKWQRIPSSKQTRQRLPPLSRQAAWLFLRRSEQLTVEEKETVAHLCQIHEDVALAYQLTQQFTHLLRHRQGKELANWLEAVDNSPLIELHPFVKSIRADERAVQAGLTLSWSQGQTEGQITRLKLIKRQGYGRARFDLLRKRVLYAV